MAPPRPSRPNVTLVVGMHRSGTSLTASFLAQFGVGLSDDPIETNAFNSRGYFESRTIVDFHDRVLAELGSSWRTPNTTRPFPARWWSSERFAPFAAELEAIVREECARAGGRWGVKDPRASRLLPLWNMVLERIGADASYVLAVREPAEVAASLHRRDSIERELSDLLWLEHTVMAFADGGARVKLVVPYAAWFGDAKGTATRLARALDLPHTSTLLRTALTATVVGDLRHFALTRPSPVPYVDTAYSILAANRRGGAEELLAIAQALQLSGVAARIADDEGSSEHATSIQQISQSLSWRQDVSEEAVRGLVDDADTETRRVARLARSRTSIRNALVDAIAAAEVDGYRDPLTMRAVRGLANITDVDAPYLHVLRRQALAHVADGELESGTRLLDELFRRSFATGMRSGATSAEALANFSGPDVLAACATIARALEKRTTRIAKMRGLVAIVYSADDTAILDRVRERERQLVASGFGVVPIASGIGADAFERLEALLRHLTTAPVPAALFVTHAQDAVARIAALCLPPRMVVWEEPLGPVAASDLFVALPEALDDAEELDRRELGVPASGILLATVGRLEKYAHPQYLGALSRVLASNANVWLAFCGSDALETRSLIETSFEGDARSRLRFVNADRWRALLKASDVYCDVPPWNGTRGPLAAAYLGIPIAAFADPRVRPRTAAKTILGRSLPVAATTGEFRDILEKYVGDPLVRAAHGVILKERANAQFDAASATKRLLAAFESGSKSVALQPTAEGRTTG